MEFKPGMRVSHPLFGPGVVRAVSGDGASAKISVDFSPSVGSKKLLAGVARLSPLDGENSGGERPCAAPPAHFAGPTTWVEALDSEFESRKRNLPRANLLETLRSTVRMEGFWSAVRERLRPLGFAPRVIDAIDGNVSFRAEESPAGIKIRLRIRHEELLKREQQILARAVVELLTERYLGDYLPARTNTDFGTQLELESAHVLSFDAIDLGELPDRDPKRRPIREQPKGVIRNRGRSADDAR